MSLELNKNIGGVGAILLLISAPALFAHPFLSTIGIVGVIMMLISLHGFANFYAAKNIFSNALYGFITLIIGIATTIGSVIYLVFYSSFLTDLISLVYPGFSGDWSSIPNLTPNIDVNPADVMPFIGAIFAVLAITWLFLIMASFFTWRSFKNLASKSTVNLFYTGGLMLMIGAFLIIAFGLGLILMWIAVLLIAIAFFQIKPLPQAPPTPYPVQTPP